MQYVAAKLLLNYLARPGRLLKGDGVPRQAARGLFWLMLAKDSARPDEKWIAKMYKRALPEANQADRVLALKYLEDWLKKKP